MWAPPTAFSVCAPMTRQPLMATHKGGRDIGELSATSVALTGTSWDRVALPHPGRTKVKKAMMTFSRVPWSCLHLSKLYTDSAWPSLKFGN